MLLSSMREDDDEDQESDAGAETDVAAGNVQDALHALLVCAAAAAVLCPPSPRSSE